MDRVWKFLVHFKPTCCSLNVAQREASPSSFNVAPIGTAPQTSSKLLSGQKQWVDTHALIASIFFVSATELTH